jgi:hypothetical protein
MGCRRGAWPHAHGLAQQTGRGSASFDQIVISSISLAEIIYLIEKGRLSNLQAIW